MRKPIKTSRMQLLVAFIIVGMVSVASGLPSLRIIFVLANVFYIAFALGLVWLFAVLTDKYDDLKDKK